MTLTIGTANFLGLLTDGLHTADDSDPGGIGIHMATHRAGFGAEPGTVDLLAATSTDRTVVGHGFIPVDGQISASVWPIDAVKTLTAISKNLLTARGKEHTVDIEVVQIYPEKHTAADGDPGYTVTLRETPALFDTDTEFQFHADTETAFPLAMVYRALTGAPGDNKKRVQTPETGWSARALGSVTAVSKRQKQTMWWWRTPGSNIHRVQIGGCWLGAALPITSPPGEARPAPSIDPLLRDPTEDP
jgi:hypothetical protein